ncbi:MAG: cyclic nucleotide-binding domain-containing protein [Gammaproteobacteria bacterium]|nr:cyclic nucleotide-binding domain-containing protein [Gammaproteobacteria bacterium]
MQAGADALERAHALKELATLSNTERDELLRQSSLVRLAPGQILYRENQDDGNVHYLLDGALSLSWKGRTVRSVSARPAEQNEALDRVGQKLYTVHARVPSTVLRVPRGALERALRNHEASLGGETTAEVSEIGADKSQSWMVLLLRSDTFARLPAGNLQQVFDRLEPIQVTAGTDVVRQGEPADYYYVVEAGHCEVWRQRDANSPPTHIADVRTGGSFGEEALIADTARNATVRMRTDGKLLRLGRQDFRQLIQEALTEKVDLEQARAIIGRGGVWLDTREIGSTPFNLEPEPQSLPLPMLRGARDELAKIPHYVVLGENEGEAAVGAFLLAERGRQASYLAGGQTGLSFEPSPQRSREDLVVQSWADSNTRRTAFESRLRRDSHATPTAGTDEDPFGTNDGARGDAQTRNATTTATAAPRPGDDELASNPPAVRSGHDTLPRLCTPEAASSGPHDDIQPQRPELQATRNARPATLTEHETTAARQQPNTDRSHAPTPADPASVKPAGQEPERGQAPARGRDTQQQHRSIGMANDNPPRRHQERGARDLLGETLIGSSLAGLIEEMQGQLDNLPAGEPTPVASTTPRSVVAEQLSLGESDLDTLAEKAVEAALAAAERTLTGDPQLDHDEVSTLMEQHIAAQCAEFEKRIRETVNGTREQLKRQYERALKARLTQIRAQAVQSLKRELAAARSAYALQAAQERQAVRRDYQRLMTLANRIARQKAGINRARGQFEEKLQAADRLQREIFQLREMLSQQLGDLDGIEQEQSVETMPGGQSSAATRSAITSGAAAGEDSLETTEARIREALERFKSG